MKIISFLVVHLVFLTSIGNAQTVTIGTQVWSTKNLDVSTFRNGDPIPQAKTSEEWEKAGRNHEPSWCYYDNDPANGVKYGKLYNWYAVNDPRGIAPLGYHVPTKAEWLTLESYLGGWEAGKKMKSTSGWGSYTTVGSKTCPNCASWNKEYRSKVPCHICQDTRVVSTNVTLTGNGSDSSGFSGLPGGCRMDYCPFLRLGEEGSWWSSSQNFMSGNYSNQPVYFFEASCAHLNNYSNLLGSYSFNKGYGLSVRCLRD